jgi:hypothetical protein
VDAARYTEFKGFQELDADRSVLIAANGQMRTASLFAETIQGGSKENYTPVYSLRDTADRGLLSAYLVYMTSIDEYDAATKLVGSLRHWRKLLECTWFIEGDKTKGFDGLEQWRQDMQDRDASAGKRALLQQAQRGDTSAARKVLDMAAPATKREVGRPATKQQKKEAEKDKKAQAKKNRLAQLKKEHEAKHGTET